MERSRLSWMLIIVATLARTALLTLVMMLGWASLPAIVGLIPTTVMSDSMAPRIRAGDVVVAMPASDSDLIAGRVVVADDPDHAGRLRLHRIDSTLESGQLILRGDANPAADSSPIERAAVKGIAFIRIPGIGFGVMLARSGDVLAVILLMGAAAGLIALAAVDRRLVLRDDEVDEVDEVAAPAPSEHSGTRGRWKAPLRIFAVGATLVTLLGSGAPSSSAAFSAGAPNPNSALSAAASYPCLAGPAVVDAPYLLYRFSEGPGTSTTDSSGNARTGTIQVPAGTSRVAGTCTPYVSPALTLNGSTGHVSTPTLISTGPQVFSVETWFRTTTTAGGKLIGFGNSQTALSASYDRHLYLTNTGLIVFGVYPGSAKTITSTAAYNDGVWHHAVATLSAAGMRLYVDGAQVASDTTVTSAQSYAGYWRIGFDNLNGWPSIPTSRYFGGSIDSVAVYTTALTATQVSAHFSAGR